MIGYIYVTVTSDGEYYIGQHKKSKFDESYVGSGRLLRDKEIERCYMIDSADTVSELNSKEVYWIIKCVEKYGKKCINLGHRAGVGTQMVAVNINTYNVFTDLSLFSERIGVSEQTIRRWINRIDGGPVAMRKPLKRKLNRIQKELAYNWVYMSFNDYMKAKKLV
jgi:hypothetical protein